MNIWLAFAGGFILGVFVGFFTLGLVSANGRANLEFDADFWHLQYERCRKSLKDAEELIYKLNNDTANKVTINTTKTIDGGGG